MDKVSKSQFSNSVLWRTLDMIFGKSFTVIISLIIARHLSQDHYGLMTIWAVFVSIGNVLVIGGFDIVLIQNKSIEENDWYTVRVSCFFRALLLSILMQICAGWISELYSTEQLEPLLRICTIDFFLQSNISICIASISRHMSYKKLFIADVISTVIGCSGSLIILALHMYSWVLISNLLFTHVVYFLILMIFERKTVGFRFSKLSHKKLFAPAFKTMTNNSIDIISGSISSLVLGKKWSMTDVGYYNRADKITQTFGLYTFDVISGILLPTFSSYQDDKEKLKRVFRQVFSLSCYIMFPIMIGLAICAKPLVSILLTDRWLPSVPIIVVLCVVYAMNPIRQMCLMLNYSIGQYRINTKIEFARLIITVLIAVFLLLYKATDIILFPILVAVQFVVLAFLYLQSVSKGVGYKLSEVFHDVYPGLLISIVSLLPAAGIGFVDMPDIYKLICSIVSGSLLYIIISKTTNNQSFNYLILSIKQIQNKRKSK